MEVLLALPDSERERAWNEVAHVVPRAIAGEAMIGWNPAVQRFLVAKPNAAASSAAASTEHAGSLG